MIAKSIIHRDVVMIREFFVSGIGIGLFCGARRFILQRSKVNL